MRVKEIERTANVAWSPAGQYPIYMVAGTAAQQLDATFSTSAALEVFHLDLADSSLKMPQVATVPSECRFHKVAWGSNGVSGSDAGTVVAGGDNGSIFCFDAAGMIKGADDCLMFKQEKHTGAVKALDFNPFQTNLLASGASESEIYIWDLNKPDNPMTPGAKSQPPEEVACVSWNRQVQHIIGSTFGARCVVWDLRKNEPIIKVSESMSRIKCKTVAWNPDVATQLCLSSEDDHTPVIQLWDLRYATSPVRVFENHQRGVLDIAWCPQDPDLLLSCGKDNRILCWNPNSTVQGGEVVYELPTRNQWCFDVKWCPRNPAIISSSSFDGHVTCYSLMGGGHPIHQADKIADAFQSNDPFAQAAAQQAAAQDTHNVMPLQKPPKWLCKPVGANFGFGGKLVSFTSVPSQNPQQPVNRQVYISQVVTETDLVQRSTQLEQALLNGQYVEYCAMKATNSSDALQENIWNFLRVNFEKEPREHYIQLLGYDKNDLARKVSEHVDAGPGQGVDAQELAQKMSQLSAGELSQSGLGASGQESPSMGSKTPGSRDEISDASSAFDEIAASQSVSQLPDESTSSTPLTIPAVDDTDGLLSQALLMGNFEAAVEICLNENKMAEAIILAIAGGPELLSRTQKMYFQKNKSNLGRLISSVVTHEWSHIIETCDLANWKEALALILTYASSDEFVVLCDSLARRLEVEMGGTMSVYACLCYVCSGNVDKFVENWYQNTEKNNSPISLQDLVEKVMVLRKAVELSRGQTTEISGGLLAEKLNTYSSLLAAQGSLDTAIRYLGNSTEVNLAILKDRLYNALSNIYGIQPPQCPFNKLNILPEGARQPQQQPQQQRVSLHQQKSRDINQGQTYLAQTQNTFGTVTTSSAAYMNQTNYQFSQMNGTSQMPTQGGYYNRSAVQPSQLPTTSSSSVMSKGALSHKYPSTTQGTSAYGLDTYSQNPYEQPGYNPSTMYSQPNYYGDMGGQTSQPSNLYNPASTQPSNMYSPVSTQPSNIYNPTATPGGPSQPNAVNTNLPHMTSFMDHKPTTAWNDPPVVKDRKPKTAPVPTHTQYNAAPITNPIIGGSVPQQPPEQMPPSGQMNYGLYNPQEHQPEPSQAPQVFHNSASSSAPQQKQVAPPPEPPKEVVKEPIPAEHQILQDIFSTLVKKCNGAATNAQTKRKLDEVSKKLEILYDRLRASSLSSSVILGLHQIVQAIQQYDYNYGLHVYTQMVSQGNFSEISSFMPGLKMLIQSAMQMNISVQSN